MKSNRVCFCSQDNENELVEWSKASNNKLSKFMGCIVNQKKNVECIDEKSGDVLCSSCGYIFETGYISREKDWNEYVSNRNDGIIKSRVGTVNKNPEMTLGTYIPKRHDYVTVRKNGIDITKRLSRLNLYISKTSREQCMDRVILRLETLKKHDLLNDRILNRAKFIFYHKIFQKNIIYRGNMREALFGVCIYHAGLEIPGSHILKDEIKKIMTITDKNFNHAEKIYVSLTCKSDLEQVDIESIFAKKINLLGYKYEDYVFECSEMYKKHLTSDAFHEITLKSRVAGIIYYKVLEKKEKHTISNIIKVCELTRPTLLKAYNILTHQT
jgi:transcription initiation factor TFIIIB Brf1 subunit/transcription initiation factor TFIIB